MMISLLFPNRLKYNALRFKMMKDLKLSQSQGNMVKSITEGLQEQKKTRSYKTKKKRNAQQTKKNTPNTPKIGRAHV